MLFNERNSTIGDRNDRSGRTLYRWKFNERQYCRQSQIAMEHSSNTTDEASEQNKCRCETVIPFSSVGDKVDSANKS